MFEKWKLRWRLSGKAHKLGGMHMPGKGSRPRPKWLPVFCAALIVAAVCAGFTGCRADEEDSGKIRDLDFTVVGEGDVPGELARIMLAIKNVLAEQDRVGTLIFDEVDAGVGGMTLNKLAAGVLKGDLMEMKKLITKTQIRMVI